MNKKVSLFVFLGVILLSLLLLFINIEFLKVYNLPNQVPITYSDVETINQDNVFGKNITASLEEKTVNVGGEKSSIKTLVLKLFGFLPMWQVFLIEVWQVVVILLVKILLIRENQLELLWTR